MPGFRDKYRIIPTSSLMKEAVDVMDKTSFVLKPYSDPAAWLALFGYAKKSKNDELAHDLGEILKDAAEKMSVETLGDEGIKNKELIDEVKAMARMLWSN